MKTVKNVVVYEKNEEGAFQINFNLVRLLKNVSVQFRPVLTKTGITWTFIIEEEDFFQYKDIYIQALSHIYSTILPGLLERGFAPQVVAVQHIRNIKFLQRDETNGSIKEKNAAEKM